MNYSFTFTIALEDYVQFNKFHIRNAPYAKSRQLKTRIALAVLFFAISLLMALRRRPAEVINVLSIIFALYALIVLIFYNRISDFAIKRSLKKAAKKAGKMGRLHYDKEITNEFLDDCFRETTADSEATVKYSMIERVAADKNAIYLYTNMQAAHIVPNRVFADEQERGEFLRFIQSRVNANTTV